MNKEDPNWIIYVLYEQYQNDGSETCYAPIGFTTVYLYHASPDKKRSRISQMLVLPPYRRQGHGRQLLTAIYDDLRKDSCIQDIINPSDAFRALHDLVSLELCHQYLPGLFSKQSILKTDRLTEEMIVQTQDICKLTEEQTQRVYEMYLLRAINQSDQEQMKHFHSIVNQRLTESSQFDEHHRL